VLQFRTKIRLNKTLDHTDNDLRQVSGLTGLPEIDSRLDRRRGAPLQRFPQRRLILSRERLCGGSEQLPWLVAVGLSIGHDRWVVRLAASASKRYSCPAHGGGESDTAAVLWFHRLHPTCEDDSTFADRRGQTGACTTLRPNQRVPMPLRIPA